MLPMIVIPTYNESENLERLVSQILSMKCGVSILVVDDNSPDGTGEIADRLAEQFPEVHAEHREGKLGLGTAYVHGFRVAMDMGADCVFEMDADFSHDPRYIPQFLSAIDEHDAVIGSRYVQGGGIENWGLLRELISRGGSMYARLFTGMKIRDATSGYRCYRSEVLRNIDLSRVDARGYAFQVEMAYVCYRLGYDIYELPIVFTDRRVGQSKMSKGIVFEAMRVVPGFRRKYRNLSRNTESAD